MRIIAVSDVHLGKRYTSYPPELRKKLSDVRLRSLERCITEANRRKVDLFLIAGDLFDTTNPPRELKTQTENILHQFSGSALVIIPGNHDHSDLDDSHLWEDFSAGERVWVIQKPGVYSLEEFQIPVVLYAAPCTSRHSEQHNLPLVDDTYVDSEMLIIGLAHGSISGYTPDAYGRYFPMTPEQLQKFPPLFWVVGHAHVWEPRKERFPWLFFPGTSEPDGFDCSQRGTAWYLEAEPGHLSGKELIFPGSYEFIHLSIRGMQSPEMIIEALRKIETPAHSLVKLQLSGIISKADYLLFHQLLEKEQRNFLFLQVEETELTHITDYAEMIAEFPEDSFLSRLLNKVKHDPLTLSLVQKLFTDTQNNHDTL